MVNVVPAPLADIVDTAVAAGSFTVLAALLTKADLVTTLKGPGPFTVFAPTDDAIAAALKKLGMTQEAALAMPIDDLAGILTYHVVAGKVLSTALTNGMKANTVNGASVTITIGDVVKVNTATVTTADVMCSNGVIHIIDDMLMPPTAAPETKAEPSTTAEATTTTAGAAVSVAQTSQCSALVAFGAMLSAIFFA